MLDALVSVKNSWAYLVRQDILWMCDRITIPIEWSPVGDLPWWIGVARDCPQKWTSWCREAERGAMAEHLASCEVAVWQPKLVAICERGKLPVPPILKQVVENVVFPCRECEEVFNTKAAWGRHRTLAHPEFDLAGALALGSCCHACCQDWHTRGRLLRHLRFGSSRCLT
eukprot:9145840-Pyramimonas_sp.AAC.1